MSFKCNIGLHVWDGCTCTVCGKIRHDHHDLTADCEKCAKCGTEFQNQHNWSHNCEKCSKCGKTREHAHNWKKDCEKCSVCGTTRKGHHVFEEGICKTCGHGIFVDKRDDIQYKVVKIGEQVIMANNFAYLPNEGNFWLYDGAEKNLSTFGYLYDFETASKIAPPGWHLPTKQEWEALYNFLGGKEKHANEKLKFGAESGFDGLYGGWRYVRGTFNSLGASGHYWSATEDGENEAWHFKTSAVKGDAEIEKVEKGMGLSVRYFRD